MNKSKEQNDSSIVENKNVSEDELDVPPAINDLTEDEEAEPPAIDSSSDFNEFFDDDTLVPEQQAHVFEPESKSESAPGQQMSSSINDEGKMPVDSKNANRVIFSAKENEVNLLIQCTTLLEQILYVSNDDDDDDDDDDGDDDGGDINILKGSVNQKSTVNLLLPDEEQFDCVEFLKLYTSRTHIPKELDYNKLKIALGFYLGKREQWMAGNYAPFSKFADEELKERNFDPMTLWGGMDDCNKKKMGGMYWIQLRTLVCVVYTNMNGIEYKKVFPGIGIPFYDKTIKNYSKDWITFFNQLSEERFMNLIDWAKNY